MEINNVPHIEVVTTRSQVPADGIVVIFSSFIHPDQFWRYVDAVADGLTIICLQDDKLKGIRVNWPIADIRQRWNDLHSNIRGADRVYVSAEFVQYNNTANMRVRNGYLFHIHQWKWIK